MGFQVQGSFAEVAYAEEYHATPASAYNSGQTDVAAAKWTRFRMTRFSGGLEKNEFESQEIRSDRETAASLSGNRRADLDMAFEFGPESHMLLMRHLMCVTLTPWVDDATAGYTSPAGIAKDWRFVPGTTPPSGGLVFVKGFTDLDRYYVYKGGRVDSVSLDFPQEGIVTGSARVLCTTEVDPTDGAGVPPYNGQPLIEPAFNPFESNLTTIKLVDYDAAEIQEDYLDGDAFSTAVPTCTGGRVTIGNTADPSSYVLNSYERYSIPFGRRRVEGSFNFLFADDGHYADFVAGREKSAEIKFVQGLYYWKVILPRIKYIGRPAQDIQGEQGIRYDVPFRALRHPVVGKSVLMYARNNLATVTLGGS